MTLTELLEQLQALADQHDPDIVEVKIAHQPSWPLEFAIAEVVIRDPDAEFLEDYGHNPPEDPEEAAEWKAERERVASQPKTIYLAESQYNGNGYLAGGVAAQLGWGR